MAVTGDLSPASCDTPADACRVSLMQGSVIDWEDQRCSSVVSRVLGLTVASRIVEWPEHDANPLRKARKHKFRYGNAA
jgi:hypothetical protein